MEHIGTLLTTNEAARAMVIGGITWIIIAVWKWIRKALKRPVPETSAGRAEIWMKSAVTAGVVTLLQALAAAGWDPSAVPWGSTVIAGLSAWWSSSAIHTTTKRIADIAPSASVL